MGTAMLAAMLLAIVVNVGLWGLLAADWWQNKRDREGLADAPGAPPWRDLGQGKG